MFDAYSSLGRLDLVLSAWEQLAAAREDIGPVASSALIQACARVRDVDVGLQLFEQMLRRRVTINR